MRPFAGQARSYRCCAGFENCAVPVGAGLSREGPQSGPGRRAVTAPQSPAPRGSPAAGMECRCLRRAGGHGPAR
ncbi:hypothetical protein E6B08_05495 [Pseudomonas putida]|uniref:Uncharacterized protein n=1 Tax=Pseudomonas putida TaxID=303 RepID=A0A4D6X4H1_PSEPU|nr:hypothetical protein E6B08_05495 [Pseudomonas putida]